MSSASARLVPRALREAAAARADRLDRVREKLAHLAALSQDLFTVPIFAVPAASSLLTWSAVKSPGTPGPS